MMMMPIMDYDYDDDDDLEMHKGREKNKGRVKSLFGKFLIFWIDLWKVLAHCLEKHESKQLKLI